MARIRPKHAEQIQEPPINLTPLIDVVFVVLIMFIVIAPLLKMDQVQLAYASAHPQSSLVSVQQASPITIHVLKDNSILLNGTTVRMQELSQLLQEIKMKYPHTKPQLFHDKQAFFGTYQSVKNALECAGFTEMEVVLCPSS